MDFIVSVRIFKHTRWLNITILFRNVLPALSTIISPTTDDLLSMFHTYSYE